MTTQDEEDHAKHGVYAALAAEYHDMASWYDDFWASYLDKTLARPLELLRQCLDESRSSTLAILDVACGTGELLRRFVAQDAGDRQRVTLVGLEPSHAMLERAAAKFGPAPGATPLPVTLCKATAEYLPLTAGSIDFAVSTNAFHFFRNKATALAEMYRVLRPHGGRLVITDWCNDYWLVRLYHWMERARWSRYRHRYPGPLGTEELRTLVSQAGFLDVRVERYRVLVGGAAPWGMQTITAVRA